MGQSLPYCVGTSIPEAGVGGGHLDWACGCAADPALDNANANIKFRSAGTLSKVYAYIVTNTLTDVLLVDLRENGASSGAGLTIGAGLTGDFEDTTGTVAVASGDTYRYVITAAPSAGGYTLNGIRVVFTPTGNTVSRLTCNGNCDMGSGTGYFSIWGNAGGFNGDPEANTQVKVPVNGTAKNFLVRLDQNTTSGTATARLRRNNANAALALTIGAGLTGYFEDLTDTESVTANDLLNHVIEGPGTGGNLSVSTICMDYETLSDLSIAGGAVTTAFVPGGGTTEYQTFQGRYDEWTTENDVRLKLGVETHVRGLGTLITANSTTATSHLRIRKNGANGNSDVSIGAGLTGHFTDTTGSDEFLATDYVALSGTPGSGGVFTGNTFYYAYGLIDEDEEPGGEEDEGSENRIECPHGSFVPTIFGTGSYVRIALCAEGVYGRVVPASGSRHPTHVACDGSYVSAIPAAGSA